MSRLPDPRSAAFPHDSDPLLERLQGFLDAPGPRSREALVRQVRRALAGGADDEVRRFLADAPPQGAVEAYRAVDVAISELDESLDGPEAIVARLFLIPIVIVTAGAAPVSVSGTLPDVNEIQSLLRGAGALGPADNFGLSNALATADAAWNVAPSHLHRLARSVGEQGGVVLLEPEPIPVESADETVHLRFLAGASVTPAHLPTFLETAGPVGRWGMAVSRSISRQLELPGLSLLAMPRPPLPWYSALAEGRFAREEVAFQLFATGAIRRVRAETGDPVATVSAREDGSVRVELASPFDELSVHAYRWPLWPGDDLGRVQTTIVDLLRDCRLERIDIEPAVLPAGTLPAMPRTGLLS